MANPSGPKNANRLGGENTLLTLDTVAGFAYTMDGEVYLMRKTEGASRWVRRT